MALDVCLRMRTILKGSCNVVMTRSDDRFITLSGRASFANSLDADLFLSVHCNSGPPGQGSGFEVWTSPGETGSDVFATHLYDAYADRFPMKPRRHDTSDGDPDKESKFTVLVLTQMPAALFELEFIHTATGEAWLADENNRQACAEALAEGVLYHLGISTESPSENPVDDVPDAPQPDVQGVIERMNLRICAAMESAKKELLELLRR